MNNIIKAKALLVGENTLALVKDNVSYTSTKNGLAPMLEFIEKGYDLTDFAVADRVVGKAAAMLFCYAKINLVYAAIISSKALDYLNHNNVYVTYDRLVDNIYNRTKTGLCPMEQTVQDIDDCKIALEMLKAKALELKKSS